MVAGAGVVVGAAVVVGDADVEVSAAVVEGIGGAVDVVVASGSPLHADTAMAATAAAMTTLVRIGRW